MLFFSAMESSPFHELLSSIDKVAGAIALRRPEHAAGLWVVSDVLSELPGELIEFRDPEPLADGWRLGVVRLGGVAEGEYRRDPAGSWTLVVEGGGTVLPVWEASPDLTARAVERLDTFLSEYLKALQTAAGNKSTLSRARELVDVFYDVCRVEGGTSKPGQTRP